MPKLDNQTIQFALVVAVAAAMVLQAVTLFAAVLILRKLAKNVRQEIATLRGAAMPVIESTRELIARVKPRIEETTLDLSLLTRALRDQTADVQAAADDIIARARRQAGRMDTMFTGVLDTVDRAGSFLTDTVAKPLRQLTAFLASARAVVDSLRTPEAAPRAGANRSSRSNDPYA
jgi:inosine-uridine nucleoside N-ribohydrolase